MRRTAALALVSASALAAQPRAPVAGAMPKHLTATMSPVARTATTVQMLVVLDIEAGWHVSWRNPGETGLPTRFTWSLPTGVSVSSERWPVPRVERSDIGTAHTLSGRVPWLVTLRTIVPDAADQLVTLTVRAGVCRDICIPVTVTAQGVLPGGRSDAPLTAVPPDLTRRLATDGGVIASRRLTPTELCVATVPPGMSGSAVDVVADSGLGLPAALMARPGTGRRRGAWLATVPADGRTGDGIHVMFITDGRGVAATLDTRRPAGGCRP